MRERERESELNSDHPGTLWPRGSHPFKKKKKKAGFTYDWTFRGIRDRFAGRFLAGRILSTAITLRQGLVDFFAIKTEDMIS